MWQSVSVNQNEKSPGSFDLWTLLIYLIFVGYVVLTLWPLLASGYYSDDLMNSTWRGQDALQNSSFLKHVYGKLVYWVKYNGRLNPTGYIGFPLIYYADDFRVYKFGILLTVIICALLLSYLVKILLKDRFVALLPLLMFPLFLQFRLYHDPVLSFSGYLQLFISVVFCSIILFYKYLDSDKSLHLVLSLLFFNIALYYTEICLPFILLFVVMVFDKCHDWTLKQKILKLMPHLISFVVAVVITFIVMVSRNPSAGGYEGLSLSLSIAAVSKTLLFQLYSMLPLSYYISNPAGYFNHHLVEILANIRITDLLAAAFFVVCYCVIVRNMLNEARVRMLVFLGLPLVFFPAFIISLSKKYQVELQQSGLGTGYIHVYIQYFGALLIMLGVLLYLDRRAVGSLRMVLHMIVVMLAATTLLINMQANRAVVDKANIDLHFRREALVQALKGGILSEVPENSKLVIKDVYVYDPYPSAKSHLKGWAAGGYPWKNQALVYQYSGKRMNVYGNLDEFMKDDKGWLNRNEKTGGIYALTIKSFPDKAAIKDGFVELSRLVDTSGGVPGLIQYDSALMKTYLPQK